MNIFVDLLGASASIVVIIDFICKIKVYHDKKNQDSSKPPKAQR